MNPFPQKENSPDPNSFVQNTENSKELIQKELDVNQAEQNLLLKRIRLMNSLINDLPATDPHYSMMLAQVKMDQIEIDELKVRETFLKNRLE